MVRRVEIVGTGVLQRIADDGALAENHETHFVIPLREPRNEALHLGLQTADDAPHGTGAVKHHLDPRLAPRHGRGRSHQHARHLEDLHKDGRRSHVALHVDVIRVGRGGWGNDDGVGGVGGTMLTAAAPIAGGEIDRADLADKTRQIGCARSPDQAPPFERGSVHGLPELGLNHVHDRQVDRQASQRQDHRQQHEREHDKRRAPLVES